MKHIKTYIKLFESNDDSIIETVNDLLLDFKDNDIKVDVRFDPTGYFLTGHILADLEDDKIKFSIKIGDRKVPNLLFNTSDYRESLETVRDYLESEGYRFRSFSWNSSPYRAHGDVEHSYSYSGWKRENPNNFEDLFNIELMSITTNYLVIRFN